LYGIAERRTTLLRASQVQAAQAAAAAATTATSSRGQTALSRTDTYRVSPDVLQRWRQEEQQRQSLQQQSASAARAASANLELQRQAVAGARGLSRTQPFDTAAQLWQRHQQEQMATSASAQRAQRQRDVIDLTTSMSASGSLVARQQRQVASDTAQSATSALASPEEANRRMIMGQDARIKSLEERLATLLAAGGGSQAAALLQAEQAKTAAALAEVARYERQGARLCRGFCAVQCCSDVPFPGEECTRQCEAHCAAAGGIPRAVQDQFRRIGRQSGAEAAAAASAAAAQAAQAASAAAGAAAASSARAASSTRGLNLLQLAHSSRAQGATAGSTAEGRGAQVSRTCDSVTRLGQGGCPVHCWPGFPDLGCDARCNYQVYDPETNELIDGGCRWHCENAVRDAAARTEQQQQQRAQASEEDIKMAERSASPPTTFELARMEGRVFEDYLQRRVNALPARSSSSDRLKLANDIRRQRRQQVDELTARQLTLSPFSGELAATAASATGGDQQRAQQTLSEDDEAALYYALTGRHVEREARQRAWAHGTEENPCQWIQNTGGCIEHCGGAVLQPGDLPEHCDWNPQLRTGGCAYHCPLMLQAAAAAQP